jgi:eukaryotic-like serine/threonine-protein kinase
MNGCPDRDQLEIILADFRGDGVPEELERHVEACAACQQALEAMTAVPDWSVNPVDLTAVVPSPAPAPVPDSFLRRLQQTPLWTIDRDERSKDTIGEAKIDQSLAPGPAAGPAISVTVPDPVPRAPIVVGYEILGELGRGGMGVVYQARQVRLNRPCALKMILAGAHATPEAAARFLAEAKAIARLQHVHIVQIYHIGEADGLPFLELEYLSGGSLDRQLDGTPWPAKRAAHLGEQLARGSAEAHRLGIVHRDLKPANVLLTADGTPKITDFGLAKTLGTESGLTQSELIMGSPSYMGPEQASGQARQAGPAADIYAVGAILYELLTGRPPFRGTTTLETLEQVKGAEPVSPSQLVPGLPRDVETICLTCLQKEPGKRYGSAAALAEDLRRFQAGEPIRARRIGGAERSWRWCRRNPLVAGLVAGIALTMVSGTLVSTYFAIVATRNSTEALANANRAKAEKLVSDHRLYLAEIHLAQQAWQEHRPDLVQQILQMVVPSRPEDPDFRGFEWYYLDRVCQSAGVHTLRGHTSSVRAVAYSPDGRQIASASNDYTVKLWDTATRQEVRTLSGHTAYATSVAYSPDGRTLASASDDRTVRLWDTVTGHEVQTLRGHSEAVVGVAYSPVGHQIASASYDRTVKLWDAATGREIRTLQGHAEWVLCVAFSPDGRQIASGSRDCTMKLWDVATGQEVQTAREDGSSVRSVMYSPSGQFLASAYDNHTVKLWDTATGQEVRTVRGNAGSVRGVAFGPDGRQIASASDDQTVRLWDAATGRELLNLRGHETAVCGVAFRPDGRQIASASTDGTVKLWDTAAGQEVPTLRGHADRVYSVVYSSDGRRIVSVGGDNTVRLWDVDTGQELRTLRGLAYGNNAANYSPDGCYLACAAAGTVKLLDAATGEMVRTFRGHSNVWAGVAYSPDGRQIAAVGIDRTVMVWDAATGQEVRTLRGHADTVLGVVFSPDGRLIASSSSDSTVKLWAAATGQEIRTLHGHTNGVISVAFSPDGRHLASGGGDGTMKLWDVATGRDALTLRGHAAPVWSVAFSPDGRRIASASEDHTVKLWDVAAGQEVLTLRDHEATVYAVAFRPDGRQVASTSSDGTVKLWDARLPTPELQVLRDARSVVASLFAQSLPTAEVLVRIRHDPTLGDRVRQCALDLAEPYGRSLVVHEAERVVHALFAKPMFRPEVLASLRNDASLSEPVRRQALALAEQVSEYPISLDIASRAVVRRSSAEPAAYRLALRQAETACRIVPNDYFLLKTLGVAQYRVGEHAEAMATLTRADQIRAGNPVGWDPADLAFLSLAQQRMGKTKDARATLGRLQEVLKKPEWVHNSEMHAYLREAESIELDLVFPTDPFAPE